MADSILFRTASRFRRDVILRERAATSEMVRFYGGIWKTLNQQIIDLTSAYYADPGKSAAWLFKYNRLAGLRAQTEQQIANFVNFTDGKIRQEQLFLAGQAQTHAEALIRLGLGTPPPGASFAFNRLPIDAISDMIGFLQDGSPLRSLLNELIGDAGTAVANGLVQGLALGLNPKQVARNIRKSLGNNMVRALKIARTEQLRAYRESTHRSYLANSNVVKGWIWISARTSNTCFPAGTLIQTNQGKVPIQDVKIGDSVLTHNGRYQKVSNTMKRKYHGKIVTLYTDKKQVAATSDHPFLVERLGKFKWMEAGNINRGTTVICELQNNTKVIDHSFVETTRKHETVQAYHSETVHLQRLGFDSVSCLCFSMPIGIINLYYDFKIRKIKIYISTLTRQFMLLMKNNSEMLKGVTSISFRRAFSVIRHITFPRTKNICPIQPGRNYSKFFATLKTCGFVDRSSTFFRTIVQSAIFSVKNTTTARTRCLVGVWSTFWRTIGDAISTCRNRKLSVASGTGLSYTVGCLAAGDGTIIQHTPIVGCTENISAMLASVFGLGLRNLTVSAIFSMWVYLLKSGIAILRAKFSITLLDPCRGDAIDLTTNTANTFDLPIKASAHSLLTAFFTAIRRILFFIVPDINPGVLTTNRARNLEFSPVAGHVQPFHNEIISQARHHNQGITTVYNLEVAEDHSYIANGFVVHNCAACWSLHGTWHGLDERQDEHMSGRCTSAPDTITYAEMGFSNIAESVHKIESGIDAFAKLSFDNQLAVLGPAKFAAYRDGSLKLSDLVGRKRSAKWGTMRYEKSLSELGLNRSELLLRYKQLANKVTTINFSSETVDFIGKTVDLRSFFESTIPGYESLRANTVFLNHNRKMHIKKTHENDLEWLQNNKVLIVKALQKPTYTEVNPFINKGRWALTHVLSLENNINDLLVIGLKRGNQNETNEILTMFLADKRFILDSSGELKPRWRTIYK